MKKIQILGMGCPKCQKLAEHVETAAKELGWQFELIKVTNMDEILGFGVMMTPALVIDGEVKLAGRVPSVEDLKKIMK